MELAKPEEFIYIGTDAAFNLNIPAGFGFGKGDLSKATKHRTVGLKRFSYLIIKDVADGVPVSLAISIENCDGKFDSQGNKTNVLTVICPTPISLDGTKIAWQYQLSDSFEMVEVDPMCQQVRIGFQDINQLPFPFTNSYFICLTIGDIA